MVNGNLHIPPSRKAGLYSPNPHRNPGSYQAGLELLRGRLRSQQPLETTGRAADHDTIACRTSLLRQIFLTLNLMQNLYGVHRSSLSKQNGECEGRAYP